MKLENIKKEIKELKNFKTMPAIKKMMWSFGVITTVYAVAIILTIVTLIQTYQFHNYLIDYANNHPSVTVKALSFSAVAMPIISLAIGGLFVGLGWTWIILSWKKNVSPKPPYYLTLAIILTVIVAFSVIAGVVAGDKLKLNDSINQVDKDAVTAHWHTLNTYALAWVSRAFNIIDVIAYWFTWAFAKQRRQEANQSQHFTMP